MTDLSKIPPGAKPAEYTTLRARARELLAEACERKSRPSRAQAYRSGENDDQPEFEAVVALLADAKAPS